MVVAKLFGMTMADRAYFGEKDWQQLQVVQRLVADLNLPVEIVGCDTSPCTQTAAKVCSSSPWICAVSSVTVKTRRG